ncbi:RIP metalloprotease RseP [Pseudoblastomonas halimionae]|uniref:Zinc metalloprotease n=1 Tax=Alteriqipengyuania halimionae TaxID=1926630 RepID=A0A6I4U2J8_9SPHN|nr:RIP metalloprotease RseP [Alteriqipengyuania halimionae]MXP09165.1 RIP metalloprotease RseP [Alteriqipengyuania halimionae]
MFDSPNILIYLLAFALVLGPLVLVHELGHYLVGRWFGVKAEAFSIGFGKEIAGWTDKRGTRWKLSLLPLGGYVQFAGDMNPASIPDRDALDRVTAESRAEQFHFKPLWQRTLIVLAGPVTNLLVAIAIFAAFFMLIGKPVSQDAEQESVVTAFADDSPAREAGVRLGDQVVAVDGEETGTFFEVQREIAYRPSTAITVTVRRDGQDIDIPITTTRMSVTDKFGNTSDIGLIGVESRPQPPKLVRTGPVEAVALAGKQSVMIVDMMISGIGQIITGKRSVQELGGPVKIAKYSGEQLTLGTLAFINFIALISINLAFINLLPIPTLDGGHLAFYAAEAVRRKPIGPRGQEWAFRTGLAFVLMLMLFVTVNDIAQLPVFGG